MKIVSINTDYKDKITGEVITTVEMNEIKPKDHLTKLVNINKPNRVTPLVEFIDAEGDLHIVDLEYFMVKFEEI